MLHTNKEQIESLGQKLKKISDNLEAAKIKSAQNKAGADFAKLEAEKLLYQNLVNDLENYIISAINDGKYPLRKVKNYDLQNTTYKSG